MSARGSDGLGIWVLDALAANGFDYAELPLAQLMPLSEAEFEAVLKRLGASGIGCEACNNFFPAHIKLTGTNTNTAVITDYIDRAIKRAHALKAKVIVFGSSGSRNVEPGFDMDAAVNQLKDVLVTAAEKAAAFDICIAIESLNTTESNIINSLGDAARLSKLTNRQNVGVLIDLYHMDMENEPLNVICDLHANGVNFIHAHIADAKTGRGFPVDKARFTAFAETLISIGYNGRLSVEGRAEDFDSDIKKAKETLLSVFEGY